MDGQLTLEQRLERVEKMLERWTEFAERLDRRFNGPVPHGYHNNAFDEPADQGRISSTSK
jgi:hypothetical protein